MLEIKYGVKIIGIYKITNPKGLPMRKQSTAILTILSSLMLTACNATVSAPINETYAQAAKRITQQNIIVDGHIDVPYRLQNQWVDVTKSTEDGDLITQEQSKEA